MQGLSIELAEFLLLKKEAFVGKLTNLSAAAGFQTLRHAQTSAWSDEFDLLQTVGRDLERLHAGAARWQLIFEYDIPRRQKRPDVVVLAEATIFVIEFKFGAKHFDSASQWQVLDYCLDLRDFHAESAGRTLVPILVATGVEDSNAPPSNLSTDFSLDKSAVQMTSPGNLATGLLDIFKRMHKPNGTQIDAKKWCESAYRPTMSIIEAAETLFANHTVRDIAHAASDNLTVTTDRLVLAIQQAQRESKRVICFVTGVPGAGKTLTGLSAVHDPELRSKERPAGVFLSGNGPLVKIVREALTRNTHLRDGRAKGEIEREVSAFIQNVHSFLEAYAVQSPDRRPTENVIVFDEAQRAWDAQQVKKKKGLDKSEASLLLDVMERAPSWCVVIALIGGGQEIHDGEGGLAEWGNALHERNQPWTVLVSPEVLKLPSSSLTKNYLSEVQLDSNHLRLVEEESLHLSVGLRNLRSQLISEWATKVIEGDSAGAARIAADDANPVFITRELESAREWLRARAHGDRRFGLLSSSGSLRMRAHGLEVSSGFRSGYQFVEWFLANSTDVRASYQLEVAATEFECQGLELDFACVCWGDDLCLNPRTHEWMFRRFIGSRWTNIKTETAQKYLLNKYRVLLTRAREGMIIWVPHGSETDLTRHSEYLDASYSYLMEAGAQTLFL